MFRDVLAGENPLDQLITPLSDTNRTTGRGLLEKYGMAKNRSGLDMGDVAGVGAEILLDPTNWITLGGKTAVGQLAQKAGKLTPSLSRGISKGERALATFHLPLSNEVLGQVGTGAASRKIAGKVDRLAKNVRDTAPVRYAAQLLSAPNLGRSTSEIQKVARDAFGGIEEAKQRATQTTLEHAQRLRDAGMLDTKAMGNLRRIVEGVQGTSPSLDPSGVAADLVAERSRLAAIAKDYGWSDKELKDIVDWSHRRALASPGDVRAGSAPLNINNPKMMSRFDIFRGFEEGTEGVNRLAQDADIAAIMTKARASNRPRRKVIKDLYKTIESKYGNTITKDYDAYGKFDSAGNPIQKDRWKGLATYLYKRWTPEVQKQGIFGNILADAHGYRQAIETKKELSDRIYSWLGSNAKPVANPDATKHMTITEVLKQGSNGLILAKEDATTGEVYGVLPKIMELSGLGKPATLKEAKEFGARVVDRRLGQDLAGTWDATKFSKDITPLGKTAKSATSLFKAGVLTHPARYIRDLMGATFRNFEEGALSPQSFQEGVALAVGKNPETLKDHPLIKQYLASKGVTSPTAKQAGDAARILVASHLPGGTIASEAGDTAAAVDPTLQSILGALPGNGYDGLGSVAKDVGNAFIGRKPGTTWKNPLGIKGVWNAEDTTFAPVKAGELVGDVADKAGRIPAFLELTRQGWSPMEAARKIGEMQTVYHGSYYTPTERQWLKNIFPFYSFQKNQLGYTAKNLLESQGGSRLGNVIKATSRASAEDPYVPDHVRQTSSIRLGDKPGDTRSYLTSLGLMHEDPASQLGTALNFDVRDSLLEAMSNMNPLVKAFTEWGTGRTAFQRGPSGGRDIEELDPTVGRIISNISDYMTGERTRKPDPFINRQVEFLLANLPTSRWMTTLRTLSDPRKNALEKLLNTTTGMRISDVSPGMMDRVKSDYVDQIMSDMGASRFTNMGFTENQEQAMDPETLIRAKLLESIKAKIAKDQRDRARK